MDALSHVAQYRKDHQLCHGIRETSLGVSCNAIKYISYCKIPHQKNMKSGVTDQYLKQTYSTGSQHSALLNPWKGYDTFLHHLCKIPLIQFLQDYILDRTIHT
jgi:hypothetical protein